MKWVVAVTGIGVGVLGSQLIARVPPGHQASSPGVRPQPFDRAGSSSAAPLPFGEVLPEITAVIRVKKRTEAIHDLRG